MHLQFLARHARVASDVLASLEALLLLSPRGDDPFTNHRRTLSRTRTGNFPEFHRRHFHVQVDAVEQRTRNASEVILNLAWRRAGLAWHLPVRRALRCLFVNAS